MAHFLSIALSFPSVVYTVLLGASLVYWVFVMVGAARIEMLGDGAGEGALDGHDIGGGHDLGDAGGGHDVGDAGGGHDAGGHDVGDGGDGGHDGGDVDRASGATSHGSALGNLMASLKLRSAPATVVLSVLVMFSWLFSVLSMQTLAGWLSPGAYGIARFAVFLLAPLVALPFTSLAVRPLARVFVPPTATGHQDLVGQVCTIRTGSVTERFGEALLEDGGAGIVVRVRVDAGEKLQRGDQAIIVGYDEERQEFTVAPMDDEPSASRRARR